MRLPRGKWWDALFLLLAIVLSWLVFSGQGAALLATEVGW